MPTTEDQDDKREVYHRETFAGTELDVCAYFPPRPEGNFKECLAVVKLTSATVEDENNFLGRIVTDAAWSEDAQKDEFTTTVDKLIRNYWAPRWKYIAKYLRARMASDFEKDGTEIEHPLEPEVARGAEASKGSVVLTGSLEEVEDSMEVFAGSAGKIIGPKGSKIFEIKDATKLVDIKIPPKNDEGPRPKARDKVSVVLQGTQDNINKAKVMIQAIVDEWVSAKRLRQWQRRGLMLTPT